MFPYVPFFPLGSAFNPENPVLGAASVKATADRLGATPAQVALAWLLDRGPRPYCLSWAIVARTFGGESCCHGLVLDQGARETLP